jgi:serine/threonine-protein kinase
LVVMRMFFDRFARRAAWIPLAALAAASAAAPARAQQSAADKAAAEALYEQGKQLLRAGKIAEACPKFAASQELDPGVGTLLHLGDCYERLGRVASAWAVFLEAASYARSSAQPDREKTAQARAKALEPRLPRLVIDASAAAAPGLEVRRDQKLVADASLGVPIPVDPGSHVIEARAPGRQPHAATIQLAEAESRTLTLPALAALPPEAPPSPPTAVEPSPPPAHAAWPPAQPPAPAPRRAAEDPGSSQRTLGLVVGAAGVVGLGVGGYFGARTFSKWNDSREHCQGAICDAAGVELAEQARTSGNVSTLAFAIGGAAVATGAVLWLSAPSGEPGTEIGAVVVPGGTLLGVRGALQ